MTKARISSCLVTKIVPDGGFKPGDGKKKPRRVAGFFVGCLLFVIFCVGNS
jgi:hypothetical protein